MGNSSSSDNQEDLSKTKIQKSRDNTILFNLTSHDKSRYEKLFQEIDVDKSGSISLDELANIYKKRGIKNNMRWAKDVFSRYNTKKIDLSTFILIAVDQEAELRKSFKKMDFSSAAEIDAEDIRISLSNQNIQISPQEAELLLKKIDKNASGTISFEEWSDYFLFTNSTNITQLMKFWETSRRPGQVLSKADFSSEELKNHILGKSFLAGGMSAIISRTCVAPLDRVKTKWQVQGLRSRGGMQILKELIDKKGWGSIKSLISGKKVSATSNPSNKKYIKELISQNIFSELQRSLKEMKQKEGVHAMLNGNKMNCIKGFPSSALRYYIYERINKHVLAKYESGSILDGLARGIVAGLAGGLAQTLVYPFDVMKTRMNLMRAREYKSIADCAAHIMAERGPKGFYSGSMVNFFGVFLYSGLDIVLYEKCREFIFENMSHDLDRLGILYPIIFGTLVNACVASATYPFATLKTRLQASIHLSQYRHKSVRHLVTTILRQEGYRGFYQGLGVNLIKSVPATFVSIMTFEAIMIAFPWGLLFKNQQPQKKKKIDSD